MNPLPGTNIRTSIGKDNINTNNAGFGVTISPQLDPSIKNYVQKPQAGQLDTMTADVKSDVNKSASNVFIDLAESFAVGGLVGGGALAWGIEGHVSGHDRSKRFKHAAMKTIAIGAGATMLYGGMTYTTIERSPSSKMTGILQEVAQAPNLLNELNAKDNMYASYVRSVMAFQDAINEKVAQIPSAESQKVGLNILVVSDLHGRDIYPQLKEVVDAEKIDMVIDAGDLMLWGNGFEVRQDMKDGIASLGVPYLFAPGNHDGSGVASEMAKIPNVIVLDKQIVNEFGLTISGAPDPRNYGDGGPEDDASIATIEQNYANGVVHTWQQANNPNVDVFVSHEPTTASAFSAISRFIIDGHVHVQGLKSLENGGKQFIEGTTGAGGITNGRELDKDGNPIIQRQYWSVVKIGTDCAPISATRYSIKDNLQSDPSQPDIVITKEKLTPEIPPTPGRVCKTTN